MGYPDTFTAIGITPEDGWKHPKKFEFTPPEFRDYDVDIEIDACAICGSDIHTVQGNWGDPHLPLAVGHEIIGRIVKVGPKAKKGLNLGDRVGVGAQSDCDNTCIACTEHNEANCLDRRETYNDPRPGTSYITQGGNASHIRLNSHFVFKIPEKLPTELVAPMLCGGITGFAPLLHAKVGKGSKVGVAGIGGIGHLTILFAKAMGAEVVAISRNSSKKELAMKLGADGYIAMDDPALVKKYEHSFDLIVNTGKSFSESSITKVVSLIKPRGTLTYITVPNKDEKLTFSPNIILKKNVYLHGSLIGNPEEIEYMLNFAAEHNIKPWVETFNIGEESLGKAWQHVDQGNAHFRVTMVGYDKFFRGAK